MEDLSKLSYLELSGRANAVRVKASRYDKIGHPDRDEALRELICLDNALKNIERTFPKFTGSVSSRMFIESD